MNLHPDAVEESVIVDGTTVTYYDTRAAKPAIVLLHGTGGSAAAHFGPLYAMLAARHRVIGIDIATPRQDGDLTVDGLAAQVGAVLGLATPEQTVMLVGYSLGAVVAAAAAARYGHQIDNLVLVAGWIKTDNHQRLRNTVWQQLRHADSTELREFSVFTSFGAPFLASKSDEDLDLLLRQVAQSTERDAQMRLNRSVDISDAVTQIRARTLVIACEYDQMVPMHHSQALFGAIPNARLAIVPSGHAVIFERPAHLASLINAFAAEATADPADTVRPAPAI